MNGDAEGCEGMRAKMQARWEVSGEEIIVFQAK